MTNLPLQHFRRGVAQFAATPEAHAMMFEGTGVAQGQLASPDFELTSQLLWQVCDNIAARFGPGWYFHLPALWSLDVQSDLESAMRFAPTLRDALLVIERYGSLRWPIVRWKATMERGRLCSRSYRNEVISPANWQMLGVIFSLNYQTILEAAFPSAIGQVVHEIAGPPPLPEAEIARHFRNPVRWNARAHGSVNPVGILATPSTLADARTYAALTATLEAQLGRPPASWRIRVVNALGDIPEGRRNGDAIAVALGVSLRSLERNLAQESTSFRELRDESLKNRLEVLLRRTGLGLPAVAENLGYSDESALSRATRRWYGCTAAEARKRIRGA